MAAGRGSRQWVTSYPTERMDLEGHGGYDFCITIATYLGRECPVARGLARDGVVLAGPRGGADIPVDAHGFVLSRATPQCRHRLPIKEKTAHGQPTA